MATSGHTYHARGDGTFYVSYYYEASSNRMSACDGMQTNEITLEEYLEGSIKEKQQEIRFLKDRLENLKKKEREARLGDYKPKPVYRNEDKPRLTLNG